MSQARPHDDGSTPQAAAREHYETGRYPEAIAGLQGWLQEHPSDVEAYALLARSLMAMDRLQEAWLALVEACWLDPASPAVQRNQARLLLRQQRTEEALASAESAFRADGGESETLVVLAAILSAKRLDGPALGLLERALTQDPSHAEALAQRALIRQRAGMLREALQDAQTAISIKPHLAQLWPIIGSLRYQNNDREGALIAFENALAANPNQPDIIHNLGVFANEAGDGQRALYYFEAGVRLRPDSAEAHRCLAAARLFQGRLRQAEESYRRSLEIQPTPEAYNNLAYVLRDLLRPAEVERCYRSALELKPDYAEAHSNLLFCLQYRADKTAGDIYREAVSWGEAHAKPHYAKAKPLNNVADPDRRLRVGYIGADFVHHSSAHFLMPLLRNHDHGAVEIFIYAHVARPDALTEEFKRLSDHWHFVNALNDDELAELIRSDRIDVLVDLGAHTAGSRLLTLARKPAPVQLSWIGVGNTTGVETVDYFLTDPHYVPSDHENCFCEKVWRLPRIAYCYDSLAEFPEIGPQPALKNGYITFGCFSRSDRFNPEMLETWAAILARTPESRILLNTKTMAVPEIRETLHRSFEQFGIPQQRVRLEYTRPQPQTWAAYNEVDIALDPFPHNAGLTSYESLWMGVPVLTLRDRPPQGRYGTSIMSNIGLPEFIAKDTQDYVRIGAEWARMPEQLAELRKTLRDRMKKSPLCDGPGFARDVEHAYRGMWQGWCARA